MTKCEICGKKLEPDLFEPFKRWCGDCVTKGLEWGMERYMESRKHG